MNLFSNYNKNIDGLTYYDEFIDLDFEKYLIEKIDSEVWLTELQRRVQHYGYRYNYRSRRIDETMKVMDLPSWTTPIISKLKEQTSFEGTPNQMIVNEYLPGQGISRHIDCEPCFGEYIASLSLGSQTIMDFHNISDKNYKESHIQNLLLNRRSLLLLSGHARYDWEHAIRKTKSFVYNRNRIKKSRRISLTFRIAKIEK